MSKGRAKLVIGEGISVWVLEAPDGFGDAHFHAHHAIQITVALAGSLQLSTEARTLSGPALAVAADRKHRFDASGLLAFVFLEPESLLGRVVQEKIFREGDLAQLDADAADKLASLRHTFERKLKDEALLDAGRDFAQCLADAGTAPLPDPRVRRIVEYARTHLHEPLTLSTAAHGVYLSPSRLRHLFVEQTGLPFKTYVLWLRLMKAVQIYSSGASLTDAALSAGFSDSAHFSRIFRRTFGLPATTLTRV